MFSLNFIGLEEIGGGFKRNPLHLLRSYSLVESLLRHLWVDSEIGVGEGSSMISLSPARHDAGLLNPNIRSAHTS